MGGEIKEAYINKNLESYPKTKKPEKPIDSKEIKKKALNVAKNKPLKKETLKAIGGGLIGEEAKKTLLKITNGVEKSTEKVKTRNDVLKIMDSRIEETLPEGQNIDSIAKIIKKQDGTEFETDEKAKEFLREQFLSGEIKSLDLKNKDSGKTKYEDILEKNKDLAALNSEKNPEFAKELIGIYGEKGIFGYMKLLEGIPKDKIPKDLEKFNALLEQKHGEKYFEQRLSEENEGKTPLPPKVLEKERKKAFSSPSNVNSLTQNYSKVPGENVNGSLDGLGGLAELNKIIPNLPEGKIKTLFTNLKPYIGKGKTDTGLHTFVKSKAGYDITNGYYCRAFLNAGLESIGFNTNKNNLSKDALNMGREVSKKEEMLPGDIVVMSRKGSDSAGNPGTHTGFFAGWTTDGRMLLLSGNAGGKKVTLAPRSTNNIIGIRRYVDGKEEGELKEVKK